MAQLSNGTGVKPAIAKTDALFAYRRLFRASLRENGRMISDTALQFAQTLVRMNTVSENSNLELIHFIRDELLKLGVKSRLSHNADKTKANLFATLGIFVACTYASLTHTDLKTGTYVLFAVLCAAASYIAVPAVTTSVASSSDISSGIATSVLMWLTWYSQKPPSVVKPLARWPLSTSP